MNRQQIEVLVANKKTAQSEKDTVDVASLC
jgi:hypothetical protein